MRVGELVGLIGAYERDNFGDLLFLERTLKYLGSRPSIATAPYSHDIGSPGPHYTERYVDALSSESLTSVLVVGGEVGGTSASSAYRMSSTPNLYSKWIDSSLGTKRRILRQSLGLSEMSSPYIPRMSATSMSLQLPSAINSAGVSGLDRLVGRRGAEAWAAVREAGFVSVRDKASSEVLSRRNVEHRVAPDLVHTLRLDESFAPLMRPNVALIQVKAAVLTAMGTRAFAEVLAASKALASFDLELFSAGSATGHDSLELYREVAEHFRVISSSRVLSMPQTGSELEKASIIAGCGIWVGTSLHGWIISSSFNRPRVALELDKIVRYAESWSDPMPVGVSLSELDSAVRRAISTGNQDQSSEIERIQTMCLLAQDSIVDALGSLNHDPSSDEIQARLDTTSALAEAESTLKGRIVDLLVCLRDFR
ncbi:polysaccharide pyruvyl transferase family protein [Rhodococcus fascians]|uniref:polysaccharide pyruvyl transferase family protein n=1 Tax=Rhodococcoides fascians TaxID=1828 RepID=UPI0024B9AD3F|nr:polysaccharide pyruvyl transferase family protein [Rhodococcus fascians]MDJ0428020.1 polysaccharide pyruvyl transferase family protein [Rhodococcus fascians]